MAVQSSVTKTAGNKRRPTGLHFDNVLDSAWLTAGKKWISAVLGQIANRPRLSRMGGPCNMYGDENATVSTEILYGKYHLET